jgi:hypothetical protein
MPYPGADTGSAIIFVGIMFILAIFLELDERKNKK